MNYLRRRTLFGLDMSFQLLVLIRAACSKCLSLSYLHLTKPDDGTQLMVKPYSMLKIGELLNFFPSCSIRTDKYFFYVYFPFIFLVERWLQMI